MLRKIISLQNGRVFFQHRLQSPILLVKGLLITGVLFLVISVSHLSYAEVSDNNSKTSDPNTSSRYASSAEDATILTINNALRKAWQENGLRPAPKASDNQWCRRLFLDLVGRVPTVKELGQFQADKSRNKRRKLVERLLGSEYRDDFTRHWTAMWTNTLIGRTGGQQRQSLINRSAMQEYIKQSLLEDKPYDQLTSELVTAVGNADPVGEEFNSATNFLIEKMAENGVQATAKTAEIFLGIAVQCTQCHNHPFNEYRQNQFWELNAFFRQTRVESMPQPEIENRRIGKIVNWDFAGEGRSLYRDNRSEIVLTMRDGQFVDRDAAQLSEAPIYYELRNGQLQVAYPVFVDGTALLDEFEDRGSEFGNSGYLEHVDRRQELARFIVESRDFDRALVNRMWSYFFGFGFTKPIHDMGPHNPSSHPELLDKLGMAFRESGFNLREVMRWIVLSDSYARSSKISSSNRKDDPALGVPPQFSRFYVRQMQPEQLYESLLVATQADATLAADRQERMKGRWLQQFSTVFGTDDGSEATTFNGSIPQTLMMMNGDLIRRACSTGSGSFLDKIANDDNLSNRDKISYLYQAALSRQPTREEKKICNELLDANKGNVVSTLQDVWWAVLNSNEFILIH